MDQKRVTDAGTCLPEGTAMLEYLLGEMAQGNTRALEEFYHRTARQAYACALALLKNPQDAEDILHDAYLRAWNMSGSYRPGGRPVGWLLTILHNLACMKLRGGKRSVTVSSDDLDAFFCAHPGIDPDDRILLRAALLKLPDEERQIVLLHAAAGLRHREIAQMMQLPLGTVLSKYGRALKKLKTEWEEC